MCKITEFGQALRELREQKNLTQEQMADILCQSNSLFSKINAERISRWERGIQKPSLKKRMLIFELFEAENAPLVERLDVSDLLPSQIHSALTYIQQRLEQVKFNYLVDDVQHIRTNGLEYEYSEFKNHLGEWEGYCDFLLDYTSYVKKCGVTEQEFMVWLEQPYTVAKMVRYKGQVSGFFVLLPLSRSAYLNLIAGKLDISQLNVEEDFYHGDPDDSLNFLSYSFYASNRFVCAQLVLDEFLILNSCSEIAKFYCGFVSGPEGERIANMFGETFKVVPKVVLEPTNADDARPLYLLRARVEDYLDNKKLIRLLSS